MEVGTSRARSDYLKPLDQSVCKTYLENLRYFARRNAPMSCERPVASPLADRIKKIEWEDLDPDRHPELFRALVLHRSGGQDTSQQTLNLRAEEIRKKHDVFRRAIGVFEGFPAFEYQTAPKSRSEKFQIVQYGQNVLDPNNPHPVWRCKPRRGGPQNDATGFLHLYMATEDLSKLIGRLYEPANGTSGEYIRTIDGRPYIETVLQNGNINLLQLRSSFPAGLESVCFYEFKNSGSSRG